VPLTFLQPLINTGLQPGVGCQEQAKAVSTAWPRRGASSMLGNG
jgi:hypothetical protein